MRYPKVLQAKFLDRSKRFIARVDIGGEIETVHVKNTGRCRELLLPRAQVVLARMENPDRKTRYDLIAVKKKGLGWVNIDSQAPNKVVEEWLATQPYDRVQREYTYGESRIDFYMEKDGRGHLLEVKGCTLEIDGIGYFPDAPTERGARHLHTLIEARKAGYWCGVAFVIQMPKVTEVRPNVATDPVFGKALEEARAAGVQVLYLGCNVRPGSLTVDEARVWVKEDRISRSR